MTEPQSDAVPAGASQPASRKTALITGGQGGLAAALIEAFTVAGYDVSSPGRVDLDVRSEASVNSYFAGRFPRLDLLVNNAGLTIDRPLARLSESDWDEILATNLRGAFLCSRAAARQMARARRGHIINIGSYSALKGPAGQAGYSAAKAGLAGLGQSLARELGPRNVRVNTVLPGFLETRMTRNLPQGVLERALEEHVLGRFNTPGDCARFLVALEAMEHVSGQVFQLDSRISRWT
jgi:3-oxoacyl-[acyl-carrier protein] reductase